MAGIYSTEKSLLGLFERIHGFGILFFQLHNVSPLFLLHEEEGAGIEALGTFLSPVFLFKKKHLFSIERALKYRALLFFAEED